MPPPERITAYLASIDQVLDWLIVTILFLVGLYIIVQGIRVSLVSGFRFYLSWGFTIGVPCLLSATMKYLLPGLSLSLIVFPLLVAIGGLSWLHRKKQQARQESPMEWERWMKIHRQASFWQKLFLYPDRKDV